MEWFLLDAFVALIIVVDDARAAPPVALLPVRFSMSGP